MKSWGNEIAETASGSQSQPGHKNLHPVENKSWQGTPEVNIIVIYIWDSGQVANKQSI